MGKGKLIRFFIDKLRREKENPRTGALCACAGECYGDHTILIHFFDLRRKRQIKLLIAQSILRAM